MDTCKTTFNYSESSKDCHCSSSPITSASFDLKCYQSESLDVSCLSNTKKCPLEKIMEGQPDNVLYYEERIRELSSQLQESLKQNEKYKNHINNLEKDSNLLHNEKIEKLLRRNNELETTLTAANKQINRLIKNVPNKVNGLNLSDFDKRLFELEQANHDLTLQNSSLISDISHCQHQKSQLETELRNSKLQLSNLKCDLAAKTNCVTELKEQICKQYMQLRNLSESNTKMLQAYETQSNELKSLRQSEEWYKASLMQCQKDKSKLTTAFTDKEKTLLKYEVEVETLHLEVNRWKCKYDEIQLKALKEREIILAQIEKYKANEERRAVDGSVKECHCTETANKYEGIIRDLTSQVQRLELSYNEQVELFEKLNMENSRLLSKFLPLQNQLQVCEDLREELVKAKEDLKLQLSTAIDGKAEDQQMILNLKSIIASLKIELDSKMKEEEAVRLAVKTITEKFKILKSTYHSLKNELIGKNKEILLLQLENQGLFMKNNWKMGAFQKKLQADVVVNDGKLVETSLEKFCEREDEMKTIDESVTKFVVNNCANLTNTNIVEMLESVCNLCQLENGKVPSCNTSDYIKSLFSRIDKYIYMYQKDSGEKDRNILILRKEISKMKNDIRKRIERLEERQEILTSKSNENYKLLVNLVENYNARTVEEVDHLKALLQVKTREQREEQKNYEIYYRTLLRKIKEQIRDRNNLFQAYNSLKLQTEAKEFQLESLQESNENYQRISEKLKLTVVNLEEQFRNENRCDGSCKEVCNTNNKLLKESEEKHETDKTLSDDKVTQHELIFEVSKINPEANNDEINADTKLDELKIKDDYTVEKLQLGSSSFLQENKEENELQQEQIIPDDWSGNNGAVQNLIVKLKSQLQLCQREILATRSDSYFFQRLCNDLKAALKTHINHNKLLREYIANCFNDKPIFNSLPIDISTFPSPIKFNDSYIDALLRENEEIVQHKPLSEVQDGFNQLKGEIIILQEEIVRKYGSSY